MPIAAIGVGLGTAIAGGAAAGATLAGAKMQSNASRRASDVQSQYADRALAHQMERQRQHDEAYRNWMGGGEVAKLGQLLGTARPSTGQPAISGVNPVPMPRQTQTINDLRSTGSGQTQAAAQNNQRLVRIQSPRGEVRAVPESYARDLVARGGRVV